MCVYEGVLACVECVCVCLSCACVRDYVCGREEEKDKVRERGKEREKEKEMTLLLFCSMGIYLDDTHQSLSPSPTSLFISRTPRTRVPLARGRYQQLCGKLYENRLPIRCDASYCLEVSASVLWHAGTPDCALNSCVCVCVCVWMRMFSVAALPKKVVRVSIDVDGDSFSDSYIRFLFLCVVPHICSDRRTAN
jgi:hypothetical protein